MPQGKRQAGCPYTGKSGLAALRIGAPSYEDATLSGPYPSLKCLVVTLDMVNAYLFVVASRLHPSVARLPVLTSWLTVVSQFPFCVVPPSTTLSVLGMM